jgi:hypothetical protein
MHVDTVPITHQVVYQHHPTPVAPKVIQAEVVPAIVEAEHKVEPSVIPSVIEPVKSVEDEPIVMTINRKNRK